MFVACVVIPTFNNYELSFMTWAIATAFTIRQRYSVEILRNLLPPVLILLVAFIASFFSEWENYAFIRDITYLLKPVFGLLVGYQIAKDNPDIKPFNLIVKTGFLLAVIHLVIVAFSVMFLHIRTMHDLRFYAGYFSDFEVYALIVLLFSAKFDLDIPPRKKLIFLTVIGFSIFMYLARTNFLQFGILALAMMGYLKLTRRAITVMLWLAVVTVGLYTIIYNSNPRRGSTGFEAFLYKVKIAPIEPFKTKVDKGDWRDFNDNYRSYENIITVRQVSGKGTDKVIMGEGLGSVVDLGRKIWTNDKEQIRYLPALHNSYMTIFLKSGLIGVMLLIASIVILIRQPKSDDKMINSISLLLIGTAVFLILSNWVFMGLYFKVDNKSVLIGYLICYREMLQRRKLAEAKTG